MKLRTKGTKPRKRAARPPAKEASRALPPAFKPIVAALRKRPGVRVEKGWGATHVVLTLQGKMFVMLVRDELVVKLSAERVHQLVDASIGRRFDPRRDGRLMKEWIVVPPGDAAWLALARESYRFLTGGKASP